MNSPTERLKSAPARRSRGPRFWWRVLFRVLSESDKRNLSLIAAGVAFYALLSLFPALAALIALWGYFADPAVLQGQLDMAEQLLPSDAFAILGDQVARLVAANSSTLQLTSLISILVALWTARSGVAALIRGLNSIYGEPHRANPIKRYVVAIALTCSLIVVHIVALLSIVLLPPLLAYLAVPGPVETMISAAKWVAVFMVVFFGISLLYRYGPNRGKSKTPWVTAGAVIAMIVWTTGSAAFSVFLQNFGNFNEVYGSLGAVVALLFWLYLSAYVVLLGAQLNAVLHDQKHEPGN